MDGIIMQCSPVATQPATCGRTGARLSGGAGNRSETSLQKPVEESRIRHVRRRQPAGSEELGRVSGLVRDLFGGGLATGPPARLVSDIDLAMMRQALALAREALTFGEVPVGAVVAQGERIIAQAFNLKETLSDPTAHAERLALTLAGQALGSWRLDGCTLYVTLEPCTMCAGALVQARVSRLVYGAADLKAGGCRSLYRLTDDPRLNHRMSVLAGVLADDCGEVLTQFFRSRRSSP